MENDLRKETNNVKHLQALLEAERQRARETNKKDSELIEVILWCDLHSCVYFLRYIQCFVSFFYIDDENKAGECFG